MVNAKSAASYCWCRGGSCSYYFAPSIYGLFKIKCWLCY